MERRSRFLLLQVDRCGRQMCLARGPHQPRSTRSESRRRRRITFGAWIQNPAAVGDSLCWEKRAELAVTVSSRAAQLKGSRGPDVSGAHICAALLLCKYRPDNPSLALLEEVSSLLRTTLTSVCTSKVQPGGGAPEWMFLAEAAVSPHKGSTVFSSKSWNQVQRWFRDPYLPLILLLLGDSFNLIIQIHIC